MRKKRISCKKCCENDTFDAKNTHSHTTKCSSFRTFDLSPFASHERCKSSTFCAQHFRFRESHRYTHKQCRLLRIEILIRNRSRNSQPPFQATEKKAVLVFRFSRFTLVSCWRRTEEIALTLTVTQHKIRHKRRNNRAHCWKLCVRADYAEEKVHFRFSLGFFTVCLQSKKKRCQREMVSVAVIINEAFISRRNSLCFSMVCLFVRGLQNSLFSFFSFAYQRFRSLIGRLVVYFFFRQVAFFWPNSL